MNCCFEVLLSHAFVSKNSSKQLVQTLTSDRFWPRTQLCWKTGHWAAFVALVRQNVYPMLPSRSWDPIFINACRNWNIIYHVIRHKACGRKIDQSSMFWRVLATPMNIENIDDLIHISYDLHWFVIVCTSIVALILLCMALMESHPFSAPRNADLELPHLEFEIRSSVELLDPSASKLELRQKKTEQNNPAIQNVTRCFCRSFGLFLTDKELHDLAWSLGPIAKRQIDTLYNHIIKAVDELNGCT